MKILTYNDDFWVVNKARMAPNPFPGKIPTRWYLHLMTIKGKTVFKYIGKPNACVEKKMQALCSHTKGSVAFFEFDKGGCFRCSVRSTPRGSFEITGTCSVVNYFYYPFTATQSFFLPKQHSVYIRHRGKAFYIYSPYAKTLTDDNLKSIREYKAWINRDNVEKFMKNRKRGGVPHGVEVIDFSHLPKLAAPIMLQQQCGHCAYKFTKRSTYKGTVVYCPHCAGPVIVQ